MGPFRRTYGQHSQVKGRNLLGLGYLHSHFAEVPTKGYTSEITTSTESAFTELEMEGQSNINCASVCGQISLVDNAINHPG